MPDEVLDISASGRLERSRAQLRLAMCQAAGLDRPERPKRPVPALGAVPAWQDALLDKARGLPGVDVVVDVVSRWWGNHPLHSAAMIVRETASTFAAPVAQRSPLRLVLGALIFGALTARFKPWRWLPRSLLFAGLVPQLTSKLVASVPIEAWLTALTSSNARRPPR